MKNLKDIRVAVIGAGYWGKNLVRNFYELGALKAVCELDPATRTMMTDLYPDITITDNYDSILADGSISAVVISTPASQHYMMAKKALQAGKDILVEKPLALTVEEGEELVAFAREQKRILMVGHILEYHPAVKKLVDLVKNGHLGKINYIYSNRLNMGKIRSEENILWSFAPHDISVIIRLLGKMPCCVAANGGKYIDNEIEDITITNLSFSDGVKAHIFVSWLHPFKEQKLVIVGSDKMAVFNDMAEEKLLLYNHKVDWIDHSPVATKGKAEVVKIAGDEPLKLECFHFLECVFERKEPLTGSQNALDVLKILSASQESLKTSGEKIYFEFNHEPSKNVFVHSSSIVDDGIKIGKGTRIWHFSHIMSDAVIGNNCNLGQNVFIGRGVKIGNNVKIQNNVSVYEGVTLEDDTFCGPSCVFTNIKTPRSAYPRNVTSDYLETLVKKGASIGANATIVCGVTIGEHALVGAGAVVVKDVPNYAVVYGNPATIQGWNCKCGKVLVSKDTDWLTCQDCVTKERLQFGKAK